MPTDAGTDGPMQAVTRRTQQGHRDVRRAQTGRLMTAKGIRRLVQDRAAQGAFSALYAGTPSTAHGYGAWFRG